MQTRYRSHLLACLVLYGASAPTWATWKHLGALTGVERSGAVVTLRCGDAAVRLEAMSASVVRVRLAPDGAFGRNFSWAVLDLEPKGAFTQVGEDDNAIRLSTGEIDVLVQRDPCRLTFKDADRRVLLADETDRGLSWSTVVTDSARAVRVYHRYDGVEVYGLGEKGGDLSKGNQAWTMWNTDAYGYTASTDPLYKAIPFMLLRREGRFCGVFFDNCWRTSFDFGKLDRGVMSMGAEGGDLDYYVIAGPEVGDVLGRYTELVGRIELPPRWSLGYHQCRYSYFPESWMRDIAASFREKRIPCDVLWFDIDYMDGYRSFTWSPEHFPDPKGLTDDLRGMGYRTIAIIDPGIKHDPGYFAYDEGTKRNAWLTTPSGEAYVGRVWPGKVVFPDFTNPDVRDWWADLFPPFLESSGLDGVWNDMNEPTDFDGPGGTVPLEVMHDNEGEPASHRAAHNIYGMQMARATKAGLERARPDLRAFTLTRATYAGGQRYGAGWTGDNISSWGHLQMSIPMALNLGLSGMPVVGPDIGGFVGGAAPELYARWIQMGALFPFARTHTGAGNRDQEPWAYGPKIEAVARRAIERRYELLPYLYTLFEEASRTGMPILRPLWMADENAPRFFVNRAFLLGPDMLVAPVLQPGEADVGVWLPKGAWYDGNTDLIFGGGRWHKVCGDLNTLPHFVRAGAIIPTQSIVQSTADTPAEPLILDIWPYGASATTVYEDDGLTIAHRTGAFRRTGVACVRHDRSLQITLEPLEGTYPAPSAAPLLRIHGLKQPIETLQAAGADGAASDDPGVPRPGDFHYDAEGKVWLVRVGGDPNTVREVRLGLGDRSSVRRVPVRFDFEDAADRFVGHRSMAEPRYADGIAELELRRPWETAVRLPRVDFDASSLPILHLRISTEHTSKLGLRFATDEHPDELSGEEKTFDVIADGDWHAYRVDLAELFGDVWQGTVHEVHLTFNENVTVRERVRIDALAFEPRP